MTTGDLMKIARLILDCGAVKLLSI